MQARNWIFLGFGLMVLVQLYVPVQMILGKERVLRQGRTYAFECAPVDPTDPFRGKYITLAFEDNVLYRPRTEAWQQGDVIYLALEAGPEGVARIRGAGRRPDEVSGDYLKAGVDYVYQDTQSDTSEVWIEYPFDRFYLEESRAKPAEEIYRRSLSTDSLSTYALVSVLNGQGVVRDVVIGGRSIRTWLR